MERKDARPVVGRFAPSPSGRMHLGNVLCALLAWLSARAEGGRMVLRIEDLDRARCPEEYARLMEEDLRWLGLDWDEGGAAGGPSGPYFQSRRTEIYEGFFERLRGEGLLYPCFCTRAELHAASAPHQSDGRPVYPGTCRGLSAAEAQERAKLRAPAWRVRVPEETVSFVDGHYGPYSEVLARDCGDFVLRRSDGVYAYQLAVTVDDGLMGITEVVRGRDLLPYTPGQLWLLGRMGFPAPRYRHLPMLNAPDGRRLSKRDGDLDLGRLRERFPGPEPLLGELAHLCGLLDRPEPVRARELVPLFSWEKVPREDLRLPAALLE